MCVSGSHWISYVPVFGTIFAWNVPVFWLLKQYHNKSYLCDLYLMETWSKCWQYHIKQHTVIPWLQHTLVLVTFWESEYWLQVEWNFF